MKIFKNINLIKGREEFFVFCMIQTILFMSTENLFKGKESMD